MKAKYLIIPVLLLFLFAMNTYAQEKKDKTGGEYLIKAEVMPEPVGGIAAIQSNIKYPEIARRAGIQGKVFVQAYIDENGDVLKTKVIKGIGSGCDEAAVNAIKNAKFKPGMVNGVLVKVQVVVPVEFKLAEKQ